jgi:hypothetical protein
MFFHPWIHLLARGYGHLPWRCVSRGEGSHGVLLTRKVITDDDGKTRGRNDKLLGHIGVSTNALKDGCTMGPPAEREYAVEPVGVDTMRPSD